tara:strand:+ start:1243 stop:2832 length:1590 start_codon:yes stop_codon:yes gene_type:complete
MLTSNINMGIPSYFAHIVRRHRKIIKEYKPGTSIHNLYLDCNSLIYDAARDLTSAAAKNQKTFENILIKVVCERIASYFKRLRPSERAYIAFDGMAPVAKLEQQRNRRYKGWIQSRILSEIDPTYKTPAWNTVAITPGTQFMRNLGEKVKKYFKEPTKFGLKTIIVSPSSEAGEGEHKIYEYIRNNPSHHANTKTIIYGLDADLIMLTLNHLHVAPDMHLFRETPDFIRSLDRSLNPNASYMLDIPEFGKALKSELGGGNHRVNDYILLCFFLGNDFLPHFPALNIRTEGIDRLLGAYRMVCGRGDGLTKGDKIIWKNVRRLVSSLANKEYEFILSEYNKRNKQSKNAGKFAKTKEDFLMAMPLKDREDEFYIDPETDGWESRYYMRLFDIRINDERRKDIASNYLEGLEWTFKYYTTGCPNWRWCYKYSYPPLLCDLLPYIPQFDTEMLLPNDEGPVTDLVQLSYVLPVNSLHLLPKQIHERLLLKHKDWYGGNYEFKWAFCRYFWEAHATLPHIDLKMLENTVNNNK